VFKEELLMKTLVVYASKHGCTEKCAQILAQALSEDVTLANLREGTPDLTGYEGIIFGAPVYAGNIPPEAKKFHSENAELLKAKKLGLFTCGLEVEKSAQQLAAVFPAELVSQAAVKAPFGGAINLEKQNFFLRFMLKKMMKIKESYEAINRQAIAEFAEEWAK